MRGSHRLQIAVGFGLFAFCCPTTSAYVQPIAWYRLGEDDPGAAAGNIGNDPTQDHTINNLDLARNGSPRYSDDTPPNSYINSTLSMFFPNWGGPIVPPAYLPSYYSRTSPVNTSTDNIGLECWVKSGTTVWQPDPTGYALIAYNGNPFSNGFGFFQHGKNYVVRVGSYEKVLAPASTTTWTHLAFVRKNNVNDFYVNGVEYADTSAAAQTSPIIPTGSFLIGGSSSSSSTITKPGYLFWGTVDETRFFAMPTATLAPASDFNIQNIPRQLKWTGSAGNNWNTTQSNWLDGTSAATWSNLAPDDAIFSSDAASTTVNVAAPATIGKLTFDPAGPSYTLSGNAININGVMSQGISAGRSATINAPVNLVNDQSWDVSASQTLTVSGAVTGLALNKTGTGTLVVSSFQGAGLAVASGAVMVTPGAGAMRVGSLSISAGALVDLNDNDLVVDYSASSPLGVLIGYRNSGFASSPDPTKSGIISSTSQNGGGKTILALFDNSLVGADQWPPGSGQSIDSTTVVGKYTYFGDLSLDGQVSGDDYAVIDANLNTTPLAGLAWLSGDANLDGIVTGDDYGVIDANLGLGTSNPLAPTSLVPEPSGLALALAALFGHVRRRARRG